MSREKRRLRIGAGGLWAGIILAFCGLLILNNGFCQTGNLRARSTGDGGGIEDELTQLLDGESSEAGMDFVRILAENFIVGGSKGNLVGRSMTFANMQEAGLDGALLGHSAWRQAYIEELVKNGVSLEQVKQRVDEVINKRILFALENGGEEITLCVGSEEETWDAQKEEIIGQLERDLAGVSGEQLQGKQINIAHEPVALIGAIASAGGQDVGAEDEMIQFIHQGIYDWMTHTYGEEVSRSVNILYGASVSGDNVDRIMAVTGVDSQGNDIPLVHGVLFATAGAKVDGYLAVAEGVQRAAERDDSQYVAIVNLKSMPGEKKTPSDEFLSGIYERILNRELDPEKVVLGIADQDANLGQWIDARKQEVENIAFYTQPDPEDVFDRFNHGDLDGGEIAVRPSDLFKIAFEPIGEKVATDFGYKASFGSVAVVGYPGLGLVGAALGLDPTIPADKEKISKIKDTADKLAKDIQAYYFGLENKVVVVHVSEGTGRDGLAPGAAFGANEVVAPDWVVAEAVAQGILANVDSPITYEDIDNMIEAEIIKAEDVAHVILDVIEGTNMCATNVEGKELAELADSESGATSIIVSGPGVVNFGNSPDIYGFGIFTTVPKDKLAEFNEDPLNPELIAANPEVEIENALVRIAEANNIEVGDIEVVIMDRPREDQHAQIVQDLQNKYPGLKLTQVKDGTVAPTLLATLGRESGKHLVAMPVAGAPEISFNFAVAGMFAERGAVGSFMLISKNVNQVFTASTVIKSLYDSYQRRFEDVLGRPVGTIGSITGGEFDILIEEGLLDRQLVSYYIQEVNAGINEGTTSILANEGMVNVSWWKEGLSSSEGLPDSDDIYKLVKERYPEMLEKVVKAETAKASDLSGRYRFSPSEEENIRKLRPDDAGDILSGEKVFYTAHLPEEVDVEGTIPFITSNGVFGQQGVTVDEDGNTVVNILRFGRVEGEPSAWIETDTVSARDIRLALQRAGDTDVKAMHLTTQFGEASAVLAPLYPDIFYVLSESAIAANSNDEASAYPIMVNAASVLTNAEGFLSLINLMDQVGRNGRVQIVLHVDQDEESGKAFLSELVREASGLFAGDRVISVDDLAHLVVYGVNPDSVAETVRKHYTTDLVHVVGEGEYVDEFQGVRKVILEPAAGLGEKPLFSRGLNIAVESVAGIPLDRQRELGFVMEAEEIHVASVNVGQAVAQDLARLNDELSAISTQL